MTLKQLEELEALAKLATPGPWEAVPPKHLCEHPDCIGSKEEK